MDEAEIVPTTSKVLEGMVLLNNGRPIPSAATEVTLYFNAP